MLDLLIWLIFLLNSFTGSTLEFVFVLRIWNFEFAKSAFEVVCKECLPELKS